MNKVVEQAMQHWNYVAPLLQSPRSEAEYRALVKALDAVLDAGGADESHPLARLAGYLGDLIADYELRDEMPPAVTGVEALRYFMERDGLRQADLPELGGQSVVSEVLSGKRRINARQAKALAERFQTSPGMFL